MIKGIFFDAADIFYHRPESTTTFALRLVKNTGLARELSVNDQTHLKALRVQARCGQISAQDYWRTFLSMHGIANSHQQEILMDQIMNFANRVLPIPGGRDTLAQLKQRGFVLGIITDTIYPLEIKMRWLTMVGVAEFIDVMACSTVLGVHKPNPAIYWNAIQQAHLTPPESAFVGHATDELDGARQAGLVTVAVFNEPNAQADYYAQSLLDLLNVPVFQSTPR